MVAWNECPTCQQPHPNGCHGHYRSGDRKGQPCPKHPVHGATVCDSHMRGKQVRRKAAERVELAKADQQLARLVAANNLPAMDHPIVELNELARVAKAWMQIFNEKLAELDESRWRWEDAKGAEQVHTFHVMFERAMDRCEKFMTNLAKLDLDNRLVQVKEAELMMVEQVVRRAFDRAVTDSGQRRVLIDAFVAELRSLPS